MSRAFFTALLFFSGTAFSYDMEQAEQFEHILKSAMMRVAPNYMAEIAKADQETELCYQHAKEGDCRNIPYSKSTENCKIKFDTCTEENKAAYEKSALNHKVEFNALFSASQCIGAKFKEMKKDELTEDASKAIALQVIKKCYSADAEIMH